MKKLVTPSRIYLLLGAVLVAQLMSSLYLSARGLTHSAQYNLANRTRFELEEQKLALETKLATLGATSSVLDQVPDVYAPIKGVAQLRTLSRLALVQ